MTNHQLLDSVKHVQDKITASLQELSKIKEEMHQSSLNEEKKRVFKFIDGIRVSGLLDMMRVGEYIQRRFNLTELKAEDYLFDYIEDIGSIQEKPLQVTRDIQTTMELASVVEKLPKAKGPKPYSLMSPQELEIAKAKKAARLAKGSDSSSIPSSNVDSITETHVENITEAMSIKPKRVLVSKKSAEALKVWNSFLKVVQAEMEAAGEKPRYDDVVKRAQEKKAAEKDSYDLFATACITEDQCI